MEICGNRKKKNYRGVLKMNVKELKELLKELPDDMEVILQKDSEGNGYSPLYGGDDECIYISEESWYGEVKSLRWTADDACMEEDEWEEFKQNNPRCLVLYTIN